MQITGKELLERYKSGKLCFRLANLSRANLSRAFLRGANFERANFERANLSRAFLREANFERANLWRANLSGANLGLANFSRANLEFADLSRANLKGADLRLANLNGADLSGADLRPANLKGSDLSRANFKGAALSGANLGNTILDPTNVPNGDISGFELINNGKWAVGYRTKKSPFMINPDYDVGNLVEAPFFSTCSTGCHPGIFVLPTVEAVKEFLIFNSFVSHFENEIVKVIFRPWECHRAGDKWRVKWLIVWEDIKCT